MSHDFYKMEGMALIYVHQSVFISTASSTLASPLRDNSIIFFSDNKFDESLLIKLEEFHENLLLDFQNSFPRPFVITLQ